MDQARHLAATGIEAHLACLFNAPLCGGVRVSDLALVMAVTSWSGYV